MATPTAEVKRVRFSLDEENNCGPENGQWDFLKYLLTLREEFNVSSVVDDLVLKGVISADAGTDVMRQSTTRAQIELCVQEVMKGGPDAFNALCDTLQELGYNNIVEALAPDNMGGLVSELSDIQSIGTRGKDIPPQHWVQSASIVQPLDELTVTGKRMSLSALAKDARTSQREFSMIVERQQELEKQLVHVMKSLDTAKDMLIKERQEKLSLRDQLKGRDEELGDMQRKYLELQKAMGNLRETNNKYHEKVTKLQIENEQLRKGMKDRNNLQLELTEKSNELTRLKETFKKQDMQMKTQEENIVQKLSMIEQVVNEHKGLVDGQNSLNKIITQQSGDISRLSDEKAETQNQMATQQRQLNFQHAQIVMLQEHMQRLEAQMTGGSMLTTTPVPTTPSVDNRGNRYIASLAKGLSMKPFNASGKAENSKNTFWRNEPAGKKYK